MWNTLRRESQDILQNENGTHNDLGQDFKQVWWIYCKKLSNYFRVDSWTTKLEKWQRRWRKLSRKNTRKWNERLLYGFPQRERKMYSGNRAWECYWTMLNKKKKEYCHQHTKNDTMVWFTLSPKDTRAGSSVASIGVLAWEVF